MSSMPRRVLPPLTALVAFERAAAHGSFKLAARDLALSPSAISHQIRNLEERLGVQLFVRGETPVRLTPRGSRYFESIRSGLRSLEDATRVLLEEQDDRGPQDLRVGVTPFISSAVLMPALPDLQNGGRLGRLRLESYSADMEFDESGLDVVVRLGREGLLGLKQFPLLDVKALPVCTPALAAAIEAPSDLAGCTLIHNTRQPDGWRDLLDDLGLPGLTGAHDIWVDSGQAAMDAAENGLGVALAMDPLIRGQRRFGRTLAAPFAAPATRPQTIFMACRPERSEERLIHAFRRWLVRAIDRAVAPTHEPPANEAGESRSFAGPVKVRQPELQGAAR
jgi:LysR family glycine cleavage system transcriptional activator